MTGRSIILDFNGVVVDDEPLHFRAVQSTLAEVGEAFEESDYFERYFGFDDAECLATALADRGRPPIGADAVAELVARKSEHYLALIADGVPLFPGIPAFVTAAAARCPLAIASGARRTEIEHILQQVGLRQHFSALASADDVPNGKPHPGVYLEAARRLGVAPARCVAIDDAPHGIRAARAAGMRCVAVTTSRPAGELVEADRTVASLQDVDPGALLRDLLG